jgi:ketosteroid isomerase-like protein
VSTDTAQRNLDLVRELFETLNSGGWEAVLSRVEDFATRVVVVLARALATGRGSGISLDQEMATVYELEGGRIVAGENFASHVSALEEARRLAEEPRDA